jgi:hypothetical protein
VSEDGVTGVNNGPYDLSRPDLAEARDAVQRLYRGAADELWADLLQRSRLRGDETDEASFDRLIATMLVADPVIALCGRSLAIRASTFTRLSTAHDLIRSAE